MKWLAVVLALAGAARADDWKAKALARLDARALDWARHPPEIGENVPCAMSCHTGAPMLLLRALVEPKSASAARSEVRARIEARVMSASDWRKEATPFYGHRQKAGEAATARPVRKAEESLATEALLNAAVLSLDDAARGQRTPATARALTHLWQMQRADGGWDWLEFELEPWESGSDWGAALLALVLGVAGVAPADRPKLDRLIAHLRARLGEMKLHDRTMLLWASAKLPALAGEKERAAIAGELERVQRTDGGWSLGGWGHGALAKADAASDPYATALATLALCQSKSGADAVKRGLGWLKKSQRPDGSWAGRSVNADAEPNNGFMSDAATAYASMALALCN